MLQKNCNVLYMLDFITLDLENTIATHKEAVCTSKMFINALSNFNTFQNIGKDKKHDRFFGCGRFL